MDRTTQVTQSVLRIAELYRIDLSPILIDGFVKHTRCYTAEQISEAFDYIIEHDKWFPTIAYTLEVLRTKFPVREPLQLAAPAPGLEDLAGAAIACWFLKAVPDLRKKLGETMIIANEYEIFRKANWAAAIEKARKDLRTRQAKEDADDGPIRQ